MSMDHSRSPHSFREGLGEGYAAMVLLVDDQLMVAEAVRRALSGEPDIEFHFCADPARAISVAEQISPTVILQDLVMPGADGLTLVREYRARAATENIPVIVLSSQEERGRRATRSRQGRMTTW